MNNKILLGCLVLLIVLAGGIALFSKKTTPLPTTNSTDQIIQPTSAAAQNITPSESDSIQVSQAAVILLKTGFEPENVKIKSGTKIVWTNKSGDKATVSSDDHPTHLLYPELNLGQFADGTTLQLTFTKSGTYTYHDHFNPTRRGTIVVE